SAWLFAKSSERWHRWLLQHKRLGKYIRQFQEDKSIPLRIKIMAVSMLWVTILFSVIVVVKTLWLKMLLRAITIGVSIHILSFKTRKHTLPMEWGLEHSSSTARRYNKYPFAASLPPRRTGTKVVLTVDRSPA
ncbi:hypothetical protein EZS27_042536, partial [termite gut metagenome]